MLLSAIFIGTVIFYYVQGGPKNGTKLWHHNFATVHHRVIRF